MKLLFHPLAEKEFEISADWFRERSTIQEVRFIKNVLYTIELIIKNPYSYRKINENKRSAKVKGFPFSVIFIPDDDNIFIVSIFHNSRNPVIWEKR